MKEDGGGSVGNVKGEQSDLQGDGEAHVLGEKKKLLGQAEIADTEWILLSRPCWVSPSHN